MLYTECIRENDMFVFKMELYLDGHMITKEEYSSPVLKDIRNIIWREIKKVKLWTTEDEEKNILDSLNESIKEICLRYSIDFTKERVLIQPDSIYVKTYGYDLRRYYIENGHWSYLVDSKDVIQAYCSGNFCPKLEDNYSSLGLIGRRVIPRNSFNPLNMTEL